MTDDYPTDEQLEQIRKWPGDDLLGMLDFVRDLWRYPERWDQGKKVLRISTGGWSGNEVLVYCMQDNYLFWGLCWRVSKAGGYSKFDLRRIKG